MRIHFFCMCLLKHQPHNAFSSSIPFCHCTVWTGCEREEGQASQPELLCVKDKVCCHMLHEGALSISLTPIQLPFHSSPIVTPTPTSLSASTLPCFLHLPCPRLSVRNLPTSVDEKQLRKVFLDRAGGHLAAIKQVGCCQVALCIILRST